MSDLATAMLILATYGLLILCTVLIYAQAIRRKDHVATGIMDGVPMTKKHRWMMLFFEFVGYTNMCVVLHGVFAITYFRAASVAGGSVIAGIALLCGAAATFGAVATFVPATVVAFHLVSLLRQVDPD